MKDILFGILVALLTPVYFIIQILKKFIEASIVIGSPFAEVIDVLIQNMSDFWKKFFKIEKKRRR